MKRFLLLIPFVFLLSACMTPAPAPDPSILRVGISLNSPPLIFKQGGQISGVEADFARKLSSELDRQLVFVELPWSQQLDYLEKNKIDIVMSGMTITQAREYRVNFTKPYMLAGLTALFRRSDYAANGLVPSIIRHQNSTIGVVKDTTGEIYATSTYVKAKVKVYDSKSEAVGALKSGRVNMVIHDAPTLWWIQAHNEAELVAFPDLLNIEALAWAVSKNNRTLLEQANGVLEKMKNDGSGNKILENWFPNMGQ